MATQVMFIRRAERASNCFEDLFPSLVLSFLIVSHYCYRGVYTFCQDKFCIFSAGEPCECSSFVLFF